MPNRLEHQIVDHRELKRCSKCGTWFELTCFSKTQVRADGLSDRCKVCVAKTSSEWAYKNPERQRQRFQRWKANNPEKARELNRIHARLRRVRTPEYAQQYDRRFNSTPQRRLHQAISARIRSILNRVDDPRNRKSHRPWQKLVGYDSQTLIDHIERQFEPDFTWQNYGTVWELDHIVPVAVHNFASPDDLDFKRCWALANLRPLRTFENKQKGSKIIHQFQPSFSFAQ